MVVKRIIPTDWKSLDYSLERSYDSIEMKPHPGLKPRVSALWHNLVMASLTECGCIF